MKKTNSTAIFLFLFLITIQTRLFSYTQDDLQYIVKKLDTCLAKPCTPESFYKLESIVYRLQLLQLAISQEKLPLDKLEAIPEIKKLYIEKQKKLFSYMLELNKQYPIGEPILKLDELSLTQLIFLATLSPQNLKAQRMPSNSKIHSRERSPGVHGVLYHNSWLKDFNKLDEKIQNFCIAQRGEISGRYIQATRSNESL